MPQVRSTPGGIMWSSRLLDRAGAAPCLGGATSRRSMRSPMVHTPPDSASGSHMGPARGEDKIAALQSVRWQLVLFRCGDEAVCLFQRHPAFTRVDDVRLVLCSKLTWRFSNPSSGREERERFRVTPADGGAFLDRCMIVAPRYYLISTDPHLLLGRQRAGDLVLSMRQRREAPRGVRDRRHRIVRRHEPLRRDPERVVRKRLEIGKRRRIE